MAIFNRGGSAGSVSRRAQRHDLIGPDEQIVGHESGLCAGFRNEVPNYPYEPTTIGFTRRRLVLMSTSRVAAVDLVNLFEIKLLRDDRGLHLRITAVRDRDPGSPPGRLERRRPLISAPTCSTLRTQTVLGDRISRESSWTGGPRCSAATLRASRSPR
jgi:hypothetical protein